MIKKVSRHVKPDESFYIVEYASGKCRRFNELTDSIIAFITEIAPTRQSYNNGNLIIYTWE